MKLLFASILLALTFSCLLPPEQQALADVQLFTQNNLEALSLSSAEMCAASPDPKATGWNVAGADKTSIETMKVNWKKARIAYERIEGSIAVLFPELDESTDQRYDGFLESATDTNLFDDNVVTGVHAIERIVWSNSTPASVIEFEKGLGTKYQAAAFPKNETESREFKEKLCAKLVTDTKEMQRQYKAVRLDSATAFRGVIASVEEQFEKVSFAATGEEESRYSQTTMTDLRGNFEGAVATYEAFRPWLLTTTTGKDLDTKIKSRFDSLRKAYSAIVGDSIPVPPSTWSSVAPTEADKKTTFGVLFVIVQTETDPKNELSLVALLEQAATAMKIPALKRE